MSSQPAGSQHTNRLSRETSPYLLQHAHNPVDWFPWGPEAFETARAEDKPILLSVGYSACHWCHVMERESFEDPEIARLMNELFVNIKVDREERPDVDQIYMQAVQSMTGHGGWPMTVFLTPDGVPFYGGTYFPPQDRHGLPAFPRVLGAVADAYREKRGTVVQAGHQLVEQIRQAERLRGAATLLTDEILFSAFQYLSSEFDERDGGVGHAPKFPQPMIWELVLRFWKRTGNARARQMLTHTLTRMARGGIYDQLGGGFHRYSVDAQWLVPHFEKMLYDNGQLARLYLHAWLATRDAEYRHIAEETLDYIGREMTHPDGGFYSAQDADSEGEEGKFFLWTPDEIREVLRAGDEARAALGYWGVADGPNFEGRNILFVPRGPAEVAAELGGSEAELAALLSRVRERLYAARERRVHPGRDDKVLAAWNGLTCRAFAEAGRALGRPDYTETAVRNAEFILGAMRKDGRLLRSWKDGEAKLLGYLEDYSMVADALLAVYEATFDLRWLAQARDLADEMLRLFWDAEREGFFDTGVDHERLVVRPRNLFDNAVPCGSSVAAEVLLRLALFTGEEVYERLGLQALRPMADLIERYPGGFGRWLSALDFHLGPVVEVALVWPVSGDGLDGLLREVFDRYLPNRVVAGREEGSRPVGGGIPLLEARSTVQGKAAAYVCRRYVCQAPTTDPEVLARQLAGEV
ncbi:MAG: thioredoxin domain-containing protein [Candidatus Rokubacteria bacterium]|nr:thioredoxin domain-containing protein [Candidatus Rokubacteria bacterium]